MNPFLSSTSPEAERSMEVLASLASGFLKNWSNLCMVEEKQVIFVTRATYSAGQFRLTVKNVGDVGHVPAPITVPVSITK